MPNLAYFLENSKSYLYALPTKTEVTRLQGLGFVGNPIPRVTL
ncbi:MAG: hypothetical protein ACD_44C00204G0007, partial [uncultured bacterium]